MKKLAAYRYCPVCSGKLVFKKLKDQERKRYCCSKCANIFYLNSKPTVNAVIYNEKGEVLLTKRGVPPGASKWDFAGGFLENGEDPILGLKREIREELGVEIDVLDFVAIKTAKFPSTYREAVLNIYYYVQPKSYNFKAMSDVDEVRWFSLKQIKKSQISYKGGFEILQIVKKKLN